MTKLIAYTAILMLLALNQLGNFWFTYGIWPRSWWAYIGFFLTGLTLMVMVDLIKKDDK